VLKFVVDRNIPLATEAFGSLGDVTLLATGEITGERVREADVLIVRSQTKVNRSLLNMSRVKFVGTTTIGIDHLDIDYLRSAGIAVASAPGCNSNSVKEYVAAALLFLSAERGWALQGKSIGVVGVGNVGSKVVTAARALGMTVLRNDPPLARSTGDPQLVPLDDLMDCDVITLHVPLTRSGSDPTYHLFDEKRIGLMKRGAIFINTSRGAVVGTGALKHAITTNRLSHTVIDVWENEPGIDTGLLSIATLATPHIAGYSLEGKVNGVRMVRDAVCRSFGFTPAPWDPTPQLGTTGATAVTVPQASTPVETALHHAVRQCYDIASDDADLRRMLTMPSDDQARYFAQLRSGYRVRREFSYAPVRLPENRASLGDTFMKLGFSCFREE